MTVLVLGVGIAAVAVGLNLFALAVVATAYSHVRTVETANDTLRASLAAQRRRTIHWRDRAYRAEALNPFGASLGLDIRERTS